MIILIPPTDDAPWQVEVPGKGLVGIESLGLSQDQIDTLKNSPLTEEGFNAAIREVFGAPPLYQHRPVTVQHALPRV